MIVTVAEWTSNALVPVTVTVYTPGEPEHDSDELPLVVESVRVILVGFMVHERPLDGEVEELSVTVPVKALRDWTVMVDVAKTPA